MTKPKRKFQNFLKLIFGVISIGIQELDETANHFTNSDIVALIQVLSEPEIFIQCIAVLFLAKLANKLSEIVRDKAVIVGKVFGAELRGFP